LIFKQRARKVEGMLQEIRTQGWTPTSIRRASEALTGVATGDELAAEFVRWLLNRCNVDIDDLVDTVNGWKPVSPTKPHLDSLYTILVGTHAATNLVARLRERYTEPEKALIALLDEILLGRDARQNDGVAPSPDRCDELERAHRLAFACLLLLSTSDGIEYVLCRLPHFDWSHSSLDGTREGAFQSSAEAIRAATLRLWPKMSWHWRADVVGFLHAHDLHNNQILTLVTEVESEALPHAELAQYAKALWNLYDRRSVPHVRKVLDRALCDAEFGIAEAKTIVSTMFEFFDNSWLTDEQCHRMGLVLVTKRRIGAIRIFKAQSKGWIARGPVPLPVAHELYEDAVGRRDLRVNDDPTSPPPSGEHVRWHTADGAWVLPTKEETVYRRTVEPIVFHDHPAGIAYGFVIAYGIDSEAGLHLFETVLRKHGVDRAPPPSWW
jgi:hypothetical protein